MTLSERSKRFELPNDVPGADRPKIWIDGRQRPRFNLNAYGSTTLGMARRSLPPHMLDAEARLGGLGRRIVAGEVRVPAERIKPDWLGRAGRVLPSHHRVGGWVMALSALFADTRALLEGPRDDEGELAYPDLIQARRGPVPARTPTAPALPSRQQVRTATEPTLHAIRSAIGSAPQDFAPHHPGGPAKVASQTSQPDDRDGGMFHRIRQSMWQAGCWALLGLLMAYALPGGAVRAMLFHLEGGDLADWS